MAKQQTQTARTSAKTAPTPAPVRNAAQVQAAQDKLREEQRAKATVGPQLAQEPHAVIPSSARVPMVDERDAEDSMDADNEQAQGAEEADKDAYAIPFLRILQSLSPQCLSLKPEYIKGAKPGMLFQTVSKELFEPGACRGIPAYYSRQFIEWTPREEGGGIVAVYDAQKGKELAATGERDGGSLTLPNGNVLADIRQHYIILIKPDGSTESVLMALSGSGIKVSRNWMSVMRGAVVSRADGSFVKNPPTYRSSYRLATVEQANDKGQWFNWLLDDRQILQSTSRRDVNRFKQAEGFYRSMLDASTRAKVDYNDLRAESETTSRDDGGAPPPQDIDDNEIAD